MLLGEFRQFPVTASVAFVCLVVFALIQLLGLPAVFYWLRFPVLEDSIYSWQLWRWFSPVFVHFSVFHIAFNVLLWCWLGRMVELWQGSRWLWILFLLASILPSVAQYWVSGPNFGGLSGVVYALVGYVWLLGKLKPESGLFLANGVMVQVFLWLVLGFTGLLDVVIGPVANAAHLGGLLLGLLFAVVHYWRL